MLSSSIEQNDMLRGYGDMLTVQDVAKILHLSDQTIRTEIHAGRIPACRIGRRLFVPKSRFIKYAENGGGLND